jgi:hypothetical protein
MDAPNPDNRDLPPTMVMQEADYLRTPAGQRFSAKPAPLVLQLPWRSQCFPARRGIGCNDTGDSGFFYDANNVE